MPYSSNILSRWINHRNLGLFMVTNFGVGFRISSCRKDWLRRYEMLLTKRVAIVTGGAVGIGRGIAQKFTAEGCSVVISDISETTGEKTAKELSAMGKEALFVRCDVKDISQVQEMINQTIRKFGQVDILVNNAGGVAGSKGGPILDLSEEDWDRVIDINLKGQFLCCQAAVPFMKEHKYGKIVNVSSMGAIHPPAPIAHYHSAKGGVISLTRNLAFELARFNITVNAILPGPIRSEFYTEILAQKPDKEEFFTMLGNRTPMHRIGTPEDVAGVALFLASDLSSYVTGQSICVGGGLPLTPD